MTIHDEGQQSSAGGAAANAGVEFQQRVAALFMVLMHCGTDLKAILDLPDCGPIVTIKFEAKTSIDDVVLVTDRAGEIFLQVKRRVSLSEAAASDLVSTLGQFVNQYVGHRRTGYYVLAVSPDASGKIRNVLRKLLDTLRLNPAAWEANPLSKAEEECLKVYRAIVQSLFQHHPGLVFDEPTFVDFTKRVFVREFAVTTALGHESAALTLLGKDARVAPELLWTYMICQSVQFAAKRASITRASLGELIAPYFGPSATATPGLSMKLAIQINGTIPSGREVILVEGYPKKKALAVIEFYRFDDLGQKRVRFKGDIAFRNNGTVPIGSRLLHRSATMAGMERWIKERATVFRGRSLYMIPGNDIEEMVDSQHARAHSTLLEAMTRVFL